MLTFLFYMLVMVFGILMYIHGFKRGKDYISDNVIKDLKGYKLIKGLDAIHKEKEKK